MQSPERFFLNIMHNRSSLVAHVSVFKQTIQMKSNDLRGMLMGYMASRFDDRLLKDLGFGTFAGFSRHVAECLGVKENSVKNWRDEFDGLNPDPDRKRKGWDRKPTPSRVYMKMQLDSWTYEQLSGLVNSVLGRSADFTVQSVDELFGWAISGKDADTQEVVEAITGGVISFSESQDINAIEGGRKLVMHLRFERDPGVAKEALRRHVRDAGPVCKLCALDFSRRYQMGAGEHCLEAHHKLPLSLRLVASRTNLEDFLVVCPSCHRVIHKMRAFDEVSLATVTRKVG